MKTKITLLFLLTAFRISAQTITYANFSSALTSTLNAAIADNNSFNLSLTTQTGNSVLWNASGLIQQTGTPTLHIIFASPSSTPYSSLYTNSNYAQYDPALTALMEYGYYMYDADSISKTGSYNSTTGQHEIYQNADKSLIFPFAYGQSFTDSYAKTNYSDATTISSYQTGNRTVTFCGFGTLQLPQGTFSNVALISELRTNSLGPDSHTYTWYDVNNGKQLLYYSENNGNITAAYTTDASTTVKEILTNENFSLYPNPISESALLHIITKEKLHDAKLHISNSMGCSIKSLQVSNNEIMINKSEMSAGIYFYQLILNNEIISSGKLVVE